TPAREPRLGELGLARSARRARDPGQLPRNRSRSPLRRRRARARPPPRRDPALRRSRRRRNPAGAGGGHGPRPSRLRAPKRGDHISSLRHLPHGLGQRSGGRPAAPRARRRGALAGGLLDHAEHRLGQHQRAHHHDRRKSLGPDRRGSGAPLKPARGL
ncbi:MAG: Oxidoreductase, GMC family, partial [uncultured Microvirga sp.]